MIWLFSSPICRIAKAGLDQERSFAVQEPGPALDVSEDVLKLWAETHNVNFASLRGHYEPLRVMSSPGGVEVEYREMRSVKIQPVHFTMSWEQVSNIIQDVKKNGKE